MIVVVVTTVSGASYRFIPMDGTVLMSRRMGSTSVENAPQIGAFMATNLLAMPSIALGKRMYLAPAGTNLPGFYSSNVASIAIGPLASV